MSEGNGETGCFVCENLDVSAHADRWQTTQIGHQRIVMYLDLQEAVSRGCKICSVVHEGVEAFRDILGHIGKETELWFRSQPPLHPLLVGIQENRSVGVRWLEFFTVAGKVHGRLRAHYSEG